MTLTTSGIWIRNIFKAYFWLIIPLCIIGNIKSCSSYNEAGTHLSSYSVHVRGYYRHDGTYINSYQRRRPGGVKHDAPYEETRFWMGWLFFICLVGGVGNVYTYINRSLDEIKILKKNIAAHSLVERGPVLKPYLGETSSPIYKPKAETKSSMPSGKAGRVNIQRTSVKSSNVHSIGYDLTTQILQVEFKNGSIYQYYEVQDYLYSELMNTPSKGKYLKAKIFTGFRSERV